MNRIVSGLAVTLCAFAWFVFAPAHTNAAAPAAPVKPQIDQTALAKGILGVNYDGDIKDGQIRVVVEHPASGSKYQYILMSAKEQFPLQMGDGSYKVTVAQIVEGNKAKALIAETLLVKIDAKSVNDRYLIQSIKNTLWDDKMNAIVAFNKVFADGKLTDSQKKLAALYDDITKNYVYDYDKADWITKNKITEYAPVIDATYKEMKGICYDYSSLFASVLRSQGIPTRSVWGYSPDVPNSLHAWNEVYIGDKWVTMDTTIDAAFVQAKKTPTQVKDATKYKVTQTF